MTVIKSKFYIKKIWQCWKIYSIDYLMNDESRSIWNSQNFITFRKTVRYSSINERNITNEAEMSEILSVKKVFCDNSYAIIDLSILTTNENESKISDSIELDESVLIDNSISENINIDWLNQHWEAKTNLKNFCFKI